MSSPGDAVVAALDIGGTKTAAALVTAAGDVVARAVGPTPGRHGAAAILENAARLVGALVTDSAGLAVQGLGVGSAGVVDPVRGVVVGSTDTLRDWVGTRLADRLTMLTGLATAVVNDVHAHGLGEAAFGAGRGARTMLFVGVGTGIGGAFVLDGAVLPGAHSAAGHIGHQPSPYAGSLACTCGAVGHLEGFASGPGLHAEYVRRGGAAAPDLREVSRLAELGDRIAMEVLGDGGTAVGSAVGGLVNVLDPHVVVVGGGVSQAGGQWWDSLRSAVRVEALPALADVPVVPPDLGTEAALVGAAALAWTKAAVTERTS